MSSSTSEQPLYEWSENKPGPSYTDVPRQAKVIRIDAGGGISSVAFLPDGKHILSGGKEGKIRRWRVNDGVEVGIPMDAGNPILNITVARDGGQLLSVTKKGLVTVWNTENQRKEMEFHSHCGGVRAMDISTDETKMATGSNDYTACVWSLFTGQRLLGPLNHGRKVSAVKLSPDGRLVATATGGLESVRIYDCRNGQPLFYFPIGAKANLNQSLAWSGDNKRLFALSRGNTIHSLDVSSGATLSEWGLRISDHCELSTMTTNSNGTLIAASACSTISLWDAETYGQIGSVMQHVGDVHAMVISPKYELAIWGGRTITLQNLSDVISTSSEHITPERAAQGTIVEGTGLEESDTSLYPEEEGSSGEVRYLEQTVQDLRDELSGSRYTTDQEKDHLNGIIESLRVDLQREKTNSKDLEKTVQDLRDQLAASGHVTSRQKDTAKDAAEPLLPQGENEGDKITRLVETIQGLQTQLGDAQHTAADLIQIIRAHQQKRRVESLYAQWRTHDTTESLLEIANAVSEDLKSNELIIDWLSEFAQRCVRALDGNGDAPNGKKQNESPTAGRNTYNIRIENVYMLL